MRPSDFPSDLAAAAARRRHAAALGRQQSQGRRAQPERGVRHRHDAADHRPRGHRAHRRLAARPASRRSIRIRSTRLKAARGEPIYAEYCAALSRRDGRDFQPAEPKRVRHVTPIAKTLRPQVGRSRRSTGRHRPRTGSIPTRTSWRSTRARSTPATPCRFRHFRKTYGYANMPLDGIWLRAPYLHNGSVPTLRDLLEPAAKRPPNVLSRLRRLRSGEGRLRLRRAGARADASSTCTTPRCRATATRPRGPALRHRAAGRATRTRWSST